MPETLHHLLTRLFAWLLLPVANSPLLALVLVAILLGYLVAKIVYVLTPRHVQAKIQQWTQAELLALRLFADQPGSFARCLPRIVGLVLLRVGCLLPACLLLLPLGLLVAAQVEMRFARRPLQVGETALVTLKVMDEASVELYSIKLTGDPPLKIKQGPLHDPTSETVYWNVSPTDYLAEQTEPKPGQLHVELPSGSFTLPVQVANPGDPLPAVVDCWSNDLLDRLGFACPRAWESDLPVGSVSLEYPKRELSFAGVPVPWSVVFLLLFFFSYGVTRRRES